ncbi:MAG: sulfatase-like hydrolase/transferase [Candidatus Latescibacterota bacterium]|nr:MAG: sulfatase-like hydrolase/transferase [Candidatus Latescibacterota bacterium]
MRRLRFWPPLLFAIHPILFLYAQNVEDVQPGEMLLPIFLCALLAAALLLLLAILLRDALRASLLTTLVLLLFFSFGHAVALVEKIPLVALAPQLTVVIVSLALLALAAWWIVRTRTKLERAASWLAVVGFILVAIQGMRAAPGLLQRGAPIETPQAAAVAAAAATEELPDIYLIVLDGYARADVMRELYDFDVEPFLRRLRQMGFHVAEASRSNYIKTLHCFTSILNMDYLQELVTLDPLYLRSGPFLRLIRHNRVQKSLEQLGYSVVTFSSGYRVVELPRPDHVLQPGFALTEFQSALLATTPIPLFVDEESNLYALHRERLDFIMEKLPRVEEGSRPRFVFAHLLAPHPPFVFDEEGRSVSPERPFGFYDGSDFYKHGGSREEYVRSYAAQARYVTRRLETMLTQLLESSRRPPVILLQSDHGPGAHLDWRSIPDSDLRERFGILFAVYLPGFETITLPHDMSPVNTFRLVFDLYFGSELGPLEHRSYYTFQSRPYQYVDVTDSTDPR